MIPDGPWLYSLSRARPDAAGVCTGGCGQAGVWRTDTTYTRRRDVMGQSFSLGRISGIRIGVNWSVLIIVALLAYGLAAGQFPAEVPRRPEAEYVVAAIVTAVAYMGSLLAHELAHSLVARRNGVQVEGITLWVLGGVFTLVAWLLHASGVGGVVVAALAWLGGINILLAVFNVIPAAPLDGGRLLQAVLWAFTKDRLKAAMWAARSGQVFGWALFVVGAYLVLARRDYSWLWFIILGWFLTSAATAENQQAVVQSRLRTVAVREIMTADPVTVPASATVTRFLHDLLPWLRHSACPVAEVARATPDEPVADLLPRLNACSDGRALVFADGQLAGIVAPADISRALERISGNRGAFGTAGRGRRP